MFPLFHQDGLVLPYIALNLAYVMAIKFAALLTLKQSPGNPVFAWDLIGLSQLFVHERDSLGSDLNVIDLLQFKLGLANLNKAKFKSLQKKLDAIEELKRKDYVLTREETISLNKNKGQVSDYDPMRFPYRAKTVTSPFGRTVRCKYPYLCEQIALRRVQICLFYAVVIVQAALASALVLVEPPAHLPHLWQVLIAVNSAGCFLFFLAYFNFKQIYY